MPPSFVEVGISSGSALLTKGPVDWEGLENDLPMIMYDKYHELTDCKDYKNLSWVWE